MKAKNNEMETKLQKKKDKMRGLIFEFQEREQEIERMKEEMEKMKEKTNMLNKRIKEQQ
jgi:hypothetical protein